MLLGQYLREFAGRLKKLRLQENITQAEFARMCGVSCRHYQSFEKNGIGSTKTLVAAFVALRRENELRSLLKERIEFESLEEFRKAHKKERKRASREHS